MPLIVSDVGAFVGQWEQRYKHQQGARIGVAVDGSEASEAAYELMSR